MIPPAGWHTASSGTSKTRRLRVGGWLLEEWYGSEDVDPAKAAEVLYRRCCHSPTYEFHCSCDSGVDDSCGSACTHLLIHRKKNPQEEVVHLSPTLVPHPDLFGGRRRFALLSVLARKKNRGHAKVSVVV